MMASMIITCLVGVALYYEVVTLSKVIDVVLCITEFILLTSRKI